MPRRTASPPPFPASPFKLDASPDSKLSSEYFPPGLVLLAIRSPHCVLRSLLMSSRPSTRRIRSRAISRWEIVLRVVVLLAAWQGPLPWCHRHDPLDAVGGTQSPWLASHLRAAHGTAKGTPTDLGWHWHVELPGDSTDDPCRPCISRPAALAADHAGESLRIDLADDASRELTTFRSMADGTLNASGANSAPAGVSSFFASFAPESPLPQRFGVLRI